MGDTAGCELQLPNDITCNVTAVGRCSSCYKAFCGTHQARTEDRFRKPYTDWCVSCQRQQKEDAAAKARADELLVREENRQAAAERIEQLLAKFRARPFTGAQDRSWTEVTARRRKRIGSGWRLTKKPHPEEPAFPIGKLWWVYRVPTFGDAGREEHDGRDLLDTGLTSSGEFVLMNLEQVHSLKSYGHKLADDQEEEICARLKKRLSLHD